MSVPILSTTAGAGTNASFTFYISNVDPQPAAQRTTVGQYVTSNPTFTRACQLTPDYLYIKRGNGVVGIKLSDLAAIAVGFVPAVSYPPFITLQPVSASVVNGGSNHANFVVAANSESNLSYGWWKNNANGSGWSAVTNGAPYDVTVAGTLKVTPTDTTLNGYEYLCTVQNATGNTNSSMAILTVT